MNAHELAAEMFAECVESEQSARFVPAEEQAAVREELRALARADHLQIRTAGMEDRVIAVRLDAQLWHESTATMREKLTPK